MLYYYANNWSIVKKYIEIQHKWVWQARKKARQQDRNRKKTRQKTEAFGTLQDDKPAKLRRYCDPFRWFLPWVAPETYCCTNQVKVGTRLLLMKPCLPPTIWNWCFESISIFRWMTSCSPVMPVAWLEDFRYSPNFTMWRRIISCFHPQNWLSAIHTPTRRKDANHQDHHWILWTSLEL